MDAKIRATVRTRANERCEYCHIHQQHYSITFHVEHVIAKQHRGGDEDSNLALACHYCNRHKGPNLSGIDPVTDEITTLFHPRNDDWSSHFLIVEGRIDGTTAKGRTTVEVLNMNAPDRVGLRRLLEPTLFGN